MGFLYLLHGGTMIDPETLQHLPSHNLRKKGPGIVRLDKARAPSAWASQEERAKSFVPNAVDAPKKASRTIPASWGSYGNGR